MAPRAPKPRGAPESNDQVMFLLGQLVEGQNAANKRMDEITATQREQAEIQRQQAASLEEFIQENAKQHADSAKEAAVQYAETAQKLGALGEDLSDLRGEVRTLQEKVNTPAPKGPSEGRKVETSVKTVGETLSTLKTHAPWLFAGGVAVAGFIYAIYEKVKGGGAP